MRIEAVPSAEVRRWWGIVSPGITKIREICHEPWIAEDVYARLIAAQATLFLFFVASEVKGFSVVEVCSDAGGKYLNFWLLNFVGGCDANRDELIHWIDTISRAQGCPVARFTSPRAWEKLLAGAFEEKSVIYERVVK